MNGGAWWAIVRGVAKEWDMTECTHTHTHTHTLKMQVRKNIARFLFPLNNFKRQNVSFEITLTVPSFTKWIMISILTLLVKMHLSPK